MSQAVHPEPTGDLAGTATERAQLYRLLSRVFHDEPGRELLDRLRDGSFQNLASQTGFELGGEFKNKPMRGLMDELGEEFTRLFLGPGKHFSAHESVQSQSGSGELWGKQTVLVKRFIEEAGFDFERDFNGIPDHISVELEFLSKLVESEADAWAVRDTAAAKNALEWQLDFITRHAGKWMPAFCSKVKAAAELPFYPAFCDLVTRFLESEKTEISKYLQYSFDISGGGQGSTSQN